MEKALFFNALPDAAQPTGYDRNYNADDISDWLETVLATGIIKSETGLKVTAAGGMNVAVNVGKAVIYGKGYKNDAFKLFTIDTAPAIEAARVDLIVLRFDRNIGVRDIYLAYKKGTGTTVPALERTDLIYELALAKITVARAAESISAVDIIDLRGDRESVVTTTTGQSLGFCPYMTAVKGYDDYYDAAMQTHESTVLYEDVAVITTLPSALYNEQYSLIEVYTNGIKEPETAYTVTTPAGYIVITFNVAKTNGAKITTILNNFIDGEGMSTALAQYTQLVQEMAALKDADKYIYVCNGVNDNIAISEIAQAFHSGTYNEGNVTQSAADFLAKWGGAAGIAALANNAHIKIYIRGKFKASTPFAGSGTNVSGYQWVALGTGSASTKSLVFDFSNVDKMEFNCTAGAKNIIFYGQDVNIIGANVLATCYAAATDIYMFSGRSGEIVAEKCDFKIITTGVALIAESGTFINCNTETSTTETSAASFTPMTTARPCVIYGGRHLAYCASTAQTSTVFKVAGENSIIMAYGVNCPTVEREGFYQTNSVRATAGKIYISGITTTRPLYDSGTYIEKNGHINMNKP